MSALVETLRFMMREMLKMPAQVAAYLALSAVIIGTILAFGLVPKVFDGFARASRVNLIATQLNAHVTEIARRDNTHWSNQTAASLLRMDQARCKLPNNRLRQMYDRLIQQRMQEYYSLTHRQYGLLSCKEL
jgi:hypothetical protein